MSDNIHYNKSALWLRPYIKTIKSLIPLEKIHSVKGYKIRKDHQPSCHGLTHKWKGKYLIRIRLWDLNFEKTHHVRERYEDILITLAHELAHVIHFPNQPSKQHPPEHFKLASKLMIKFTKVLEREMITDTSERFSLDLMQKYIDKELA